MKKILLGLVLSSVVLAINAQSQLTATIVGSGSPNYNENRASASTLISAGDTHILVDMGNGTQANLNKLGVDIRTLSSLLFTHHHLDHNEEFVPIFIRSLLGSHHFSIMGPPGTEALANNNLELYQEDIAYRLSKSGRVMEERADAFTLKELKGGESFRIGDILVSTLQVPHTIHTIAYRFEHNGQSIVISGDLTYSDKLGGFAQHADFLIIDAGGMKMTGGKTRKSNGNNNTAKKANKSGKTSTGKSKNARAHLSLADSSRIAQQAQVKNLVYSHFNKGDIDTLASLKEIHKNYIGRVIFGADLMRLNSEPDNVTEKNVTKNSAVQNSASVLRKATAKPAANRFIKRLDKNGDGKVSAAEFKRGAKQFKHLDKNSDGYITEDEAPSKGPKSR